MLGNEPNHDKSGARDSGTGGRIESGKPAVVELVTGETIEAPHHYWSGDNNRLFVCEDGRSEGITRDFPRESVEQVVRVEFVGFISGGEL